MMPSKFQNQGSQKNSRKGSGKTSSTRRSTSIKSKTPLRESGRTLEEHHQHAGHNPHYERHNMNMNADQKLNKLINEYRMENERTAAKISDLKDRLTASQSRGGRRKSPGKAQPSYSKSFKNNNGQDFFGMDDRSPQSSKKSRDIENPYRYQMSA